MEERERTRERVAEHYAENTTDKPREASGACPHCGAALGSERFEFCPVCGGKLVDYCTFCGAPMRPDDIDCPDCGMPAEGVVCPHCNVRNFRSFCRSCGQPLSRAARRAVEKALQDPKVQQTARLLSKVAELEAELKNSAPAGQETDASEPGEIDLMVRELMAKAGFTQAEKPLATQRRVGRSREEVLAEYQKAVETADKALEEMLPPAGMTPQEQRNFHTARKVAMKELVSQVAYTEWECNYCHVLHSDPSQCARPQLGGTWHTRTITIEKTVYKRQ